ncbi:glutamine synthetase family protein [Rhodobacter sp. KR11]|uniref:glutamine synthetase family protein n=1 Tax=Rhodobacter sp. KR11 TaxID=2974588 RepID=UPI002223792C|nr:glutamine synthetase family protein [Rhodobacter sp. KR11]MCW1918671.1 glutamine synthetase family protein [Rhodobacter sp. KR11]
MKADPSEAQAFLDANPQIEAFDLVLIDANGIARGKIIRRHELMGVYTHGRHLPISILGLDILGEDVEATGLVWDEGDADRRAWPLPGALKPLHGTNRGEVQVSLYELDGAPMTSDPRHALAAQVQALAEQGLRASGAFELEFFLLEPELGPDGKVVAARDVLDGRAGRRTDVYSVDALHGMLPFLDDVYAAARLSDLPAETAISEYAPGQFELTLHYRDDVLQAADDLCRLKRIVRAMARKHGRLACFMAKPHEDRAGSGMHFHVSLWQGARNILVEDQEGQWNAPLRHAIGGLAATMGEAMLVFAPHANSWRRFVGNSYAPVKPTWGVNNRSVALRIPAGSKSARRIEHRPSGVDANPYLVAAVVLAGIRQGLAQGIDPGPETTGNGYADSPLSGAPTLPRDWREAIEAARGSDFLKAALGEGLHRTFLAVIGAEYARVAREVSELDLRLYLQTV